LLKQKLNTQKMNLIYDNIIFSLQRAGGVSLYWYELISRLNRTDYITSYYGKKNNNIFANDLGLDTKLETKIPAKIQRYLPFLKKVPSYSIFHSSYYRLSFQKDIINITTVHDFTYEKYRRGFPQIIHSWQKGLAIRLSDGIICVSENTKKDLLRNYPNIPENNIRVIYNGVGDEYHPIPPGGQTKFPYLDEVISNPYVLFVGDRSAYKNFNMVIDVIKQLHDFNLIVVGGSEFSTEELQGMYRVRERIQRLKGITNSDLNILYNQASCLIYPSDYEGFGIPILEAMRAGCPVICSSVSSIPEVAGDGAIMIKNISAQKIVEKIQCLKNKKYREELVSKGMLQSNKFSWEKCFSMTMRFYNDVYKEKYN
jgi:glycosyltransferase involved in cell wall biosynthesis